MTTDIDEAIRLSQALYFQSLDSRSVEGMMAVFDVNARVVYGANEITGSIAIKSWLDDYFATSPKEALTKHICSNMVITSSPDSAEAKSDVAVFMWDISGGWRIQSVTRHHDKLAPQPNGQWLFIEKRIESVGT